MSYTVIVKFNPQVIDELDSLCRKFGAKDKGELIAKSLRLAQLYADKVFDKQQRLLIETNGQLEVFKPF